MALTLPVEQRLEKVNLVAYFAAHRDGWLEAARKAHDYLAAEYETIRPDDVAKILDRRPLPSVGRFPCQCVCVYLR